MRIALLAAVAGKIGSDFPDVAASQEPEKDDFIQEVPITQGGPKAIRQGILPLEQGIVIDHICKDEDPALIWSYFDTIRNVMGFSDCGYLGVVRSRSDGGHKGIISLPGHQEPSERQVKMLAAVTPGCTLNIIDDGRVTKKYRLQMPPRIYGFDEISCKNEACISHPLHAENVPAEFYRRGKSTFICKYCEKPHSFKDIWREGKF